MTATGTAWAASCRVLAGHEAASAHESWSNSGKEAPCMEQRRVRPRLTDSLGFERTLADGHEAVALPGGRDWLLLGLGRTPEGGARLPPGGVRYVEARIFRRAGPDWRAAISSAWRRVRASIPLPGQHLAYCQPELFPTSGAVRAACCCRARPGRRAPVLCRHGQPAYRPWRAFAGGAGRGAVTGRASGPWMRAAPALFFVNFRARPLRRVQA